MLTITKREALLRLSTPLVVDAMNQLHLPEGVVDPAIRPVIPFTKMVGTAVTVLLESQFNQRKANLDAYFQIFEISKEMAFPIITVEVPKVHHHQGIFGKGTATMALRNGFVGALIEGAVRDTNDLCRMKFTAFSRTIAPGYILGKVEVVHCNKPVYIGGIAVSAGQIIFGDNDGVVVIDPTYLNTVIEKAQAIQKREDKVHRLITKGCSSKDAEMNVGPMP